MRQRSKKVDIFRLPVKGFTSPVFCRSQGSDFAVLRQVLGRQDAAIDFDTPPQFIVDAGANVGYSSLLFNLRYPKATIVAIEPDKANCEMFRKNCSSYSNIRLLEGAIWPSKTSLSITNPTADAWGFQVGETSSDKTSTSIRGITIPEILDEFNVERIDLLKLDIEGAEKALFMSGTEFWLDRVDVILVELHDRFVPGCSDSFAALLERVEHTRETRGEYDCARLRQYVDRPSVPQRVSGT